MQQMKELETVPTQTNYAGEEYVKSWTPGKSNAHLVPENWTAHPPGAGGVNSELQLTGGVNVNYD